MASSKSYYHAYKEDDLARELMKRLVQAVGRAFYDDAKVAVLDILCEHPYYLRDGRRIENEKDENEKVKAEDEEDEKEEDLAKRAMDERMNLPAQLLRGILNSLELEEKFIKSEEVEKHKYYYIDYDWFFKVLSLRLRRMTEELSEREQTLRRATVYVCPLCHFEISEAKFTVPHCERCVGSGENTPKECHLVEQNNAAELLHIIAMRKKMETQLFMKYSPPNVDQVTLAKQLLSHFRECELRQQPIYPIPLYDIKKILDGFLTQGIPRGGFAKNVPSDSITKLMDSRRRKRQNEDKGVFTSAHFEALKKNNRTQPMPASSSMSTIPQEVGFVDFDSGDINIAEIAKRAKLEKEQREALLEAPTTSLGDIGDDEGDDEEFEEG